MNREKSVAYQKNGKICLIKWLNYKEYKLIFLKKKKVFRIVFFEKRKEKKTYKHSQTFANMHSCLRN
jgi:hypothetical protein